MSIIWDRGYEREGSTIKAIKFWRILKFGQVEVKVEKKKNFSFVIFFCYIVSLHCLYQMQTFWGLFKFGTKETREKIQEI